MPSTDSVHNTHISEQLTRLHAALLEITSAMNRPQRDEVLIRAAGIPLDRALFPLLVGIDRFGPIGVVDMADRVGRDHTTVSRQFARLEALGLITRQASATDRRSREAVITAKGKAMTDRVDAARDALGRAIFASWDRDEVETLVTLMTRFAAAFRDIPPDPATPPPAPNAAG